MTVISRRSFLKGSMGVAGLMTLGSLGVVSLESLLPPKVSLCDERSDTLRYPDKAEEGKWWAAKAGQEVLEADFTAVNQWAPVIWRGQQVEDELQVCFLPALVVALERDVAEEPLAQGLVLDTGTLTLMCVCTKCVHLCCTPQFVDKSGDKYEKKILCPCHLSNYDPYELVEEVDENGTTVTAAVLVSGPAPRGQPLVPIASEGGKLVALNETLDWYKYCGS